MNTLQVHCKEAEKQMSTEIFWNRLRRKVLLTDFFTTVGHKMQFDASFMRTTDVSSFEKSDPKCQPYHCQT